MLICHFYIFLSKVPFQVFCLALGCVDLLVSCKTPLYIVYTKLLSDMCFANILLWAFILKIVFILKTLFWRAEVFFLIRSHLSIFLLFMLFESYLIISLKITFFFYVSSRKCKVSVLTFNFIIFCGNWYEEEVVIYIDFLFVFQEFDYCVSSCDSLCEY